MQHLGPRLRRSGVLLTVALSWASLTLTPARGGDPDPQPSATPLKPSPSERTEIRQLMTQLVRGRHESKRSQAATALGRFGTKADMALPNLIKALEDREANVACAAAAALPLVGPQSKPAVKGLLGALTQTKSAVLRQAAADALGRYGPLAEPAIPALTSAVSGADLDLAVEAAEALAGLGAPALEQGGAALRQALASSERRLQIAAATALARLGDASPKTIEVLAAAVRPGGNGSPEVRRAACESLGALGERAREAVPALSAAAAESPQINPGLPYAEQRREQHEAVRRAAVTALGAIGGEAARAAVERALKVASLKEAAQAALERLGG